jgi:hypothetical protein
MFRSDAVPAPSNGVRFRFGLIRLGPVPPAESPSPIQPLCERFFRSQKSGSGIVTDPYYAIASAGPSKPSASFSSASECVFATSM